MTSVKVSESKSTSTSNSQSILPYETMSIPVLKGHLKLMGLKQSGSKSLLVKRLRNVEELSAVSTVNTLQFKQKKVTFAASPTFAKPESMSLQRAHKLFHKFQSDFNLSIAEEIWGSEADHFLHKWEHNCQSNVIKFLAVLDFMEKDRVMNYITHRLLSDPLSMNDCSS